MRRVTTVGHPCARSTGAEMVSRYCQDAEDWKSAIEFLLMAKRTPDAFALAKSHGQMDVFTTVSLLVSMPVVWCPFLLFSGLLARTKDHELFILPSR